MSVEGGTGSQAGTEKFIRTAIRNIWRSLLAKEIIHVFDNIRALIEMQILVSSIFLNPAYESRTGSRLIAIGLPPEKQKGKYNTT